MAEDGENFGWFAYAPNSQTVFRSSEHPHGRPPTQVLFLGGRSGVGKSTVALALQDLLRERDIHHALIDGDNLDLAHPAPWVEHPDARLAENNLAAMWGNYRALGYSRLIYTNTVSVLQMSRLSMALGGEVDAVGILLEASDRQARRRLGQRERGGSLREHVERSKAAAKRLEQESPEDVHRVNTSGRTPEQIAAQLLELIGWE
ncbi:adenylyl-sulfate kinase [Mycetocola manganoxydans]|uniref:Adenylyl-sulfate kinase n=2 Tax=Mycetocola manganoxydans TaxID=699879 RepID=A0A3L6ZKI4_9MICO|nr:adenylyl-sulfate kinase [Mycetocola manganoxydans]